MHDAAFDPSGPPPVAELDPDTVELGDPQGQGHLSRPAEGQPPLGFDVQLATDAVHVAPL